MYEKRNRNLGGGKSTDGGREGRKRVSGAARLEPGPADRALGMGFKGRKCPVTILYYLRCKPPIS